MACEVISLAASVKCFELGPEKVRRVDGANDQAAAQLDVPGCLQSIWIPTVRKAEDVRVQWHDIQDQCAVNPPAQRSAFAAVFFESKSAKALGEHGVLGVGTDLRDDVHVVGSAYGRGARIVDQQTRCAAADKDDFRKEPAQSFSSQFQQFKIRIWHR